MATVAISNSMFDAAAKTAGLPLWKWLASLSTAQLAHILPWDEVTPAFTQERGLQVLEEHFNSRASRFDKLESDSCVMPTYFTTWGGWDKTRIIACCLEAKDNGQKGAKLKAGLGYETDEERFEAVRKAVGDDFQLSYDTNQICSFANQAASARRIDALELAKRLEQFRPHIFEEPIGPHVASRFAALKEEFSRAGLKVKLGTGENCQNAAIAADFIAQDAVDVWQGDAARLSLPENILIMLMCAEKNMPINWHAGGTALCNMTRQLGAFNYLCCRPTLEDVTLEYVDIFGEHFLPEAKLTRGHYDMTDDTPDYMSSTDEALWQFAFPYGRVWNELGT